MSDLLDIRHNGQAVELTLNDPERRNPMSNAMIAALLAAFRRPDVTDASVIVLRGAGEDFCAGGNINDFRETLEMSATQQWETGEEFKTLLMTMRSLRPVLVAAVRGRALGGGCGLVASCDFAVAAASARFGTPEIRLGAFPMIIVPALVEAMGPRKTLQMATQGHLIGTEEALNCGLIQQIVPDADFDATVERLTADCGKTSASALRIGKACVWASAEAPRGTGAELGMAMRALLFSSPEFSTGVREFLARSESQ